MPVNLEPQLATLVTSVPEGEQWVHEIKYDGYRILTFFEKSKVRLLTRNGNDWRGKMPRLVKHLQQLRLQGAVLDGEVVAVDRNGRTDFQKLQQGFARGTRAYEGELHYYVFDAPFINGQDLRSLPLIERKQILREKVFREGLENGPLCYSDHIVGSGGDFFRHACDMKLEGIISKLADSPYRSGRTRSWLKLKCITRQEFIIAGYTAPAGARKHFGALLLAVQDSGNLRYVGKVGTGFNEEVLRDLYKRMQPLRQDKPSVDGVPRAETRSATWIKPQLLAEVAYSELTQDGVVRHPSFKGLREDKEPADVVVETPVDTAEVSPKRPVKRPSNPADNTVAGIAISNPDRPVFPGTSITKLELASYFELVAERMLPFVVRRPLSLVRCPRGAGSSCFYQKHFDAARPAHVHEVKVSEKAGKMPYGYVTDVKGLVALAQNGVIELHPWGSKIDNVEKPDLMIFDLDPGDDVPWGEVLGVAFALRDRLHEFELQSFPKTSGGKGLHLYVPIRRTATWEEVRGFSRWLSEDLVKLNPSRLTAKAAKGARSGRIYVDYMRNGRGATCVAPWCSRARPGAPVSCPVTWDEVRPDLKPDTWSISNIAERLAGKDPWADFATCNQSLRKSALRETLN